MAAQQQYTALQDKQADYPRQHDEYPLQPRDNQSQQAGYQPPQASYPPQQGGSQPQQARYLPQQATYPPPQPSYLPQQGGFPPQPASLPLQQAGYPPQQAGYPLQQEGYPPQQAGYPLQQAGYPLQQAGYPPQQAGYPLQQAGYTPQQGYPQPPLQQETNTTDVIYQQPSARNTVSVEFGESPVRTVCPHCRVTVVSTTHQVPGGKACLCCVLLACCGCGAGCCLLPFCMDECLDVVHACPLCKNKIGFYQQPL